MSSHAPKVFGEFRVEDWYTSCSDLTFPTDFLPLTIGKANAIIHLYELFHKYPRQLLPVEEQAGATDEKLVARKIQMIQLLELCNADKLEEEFYNSQLEHQTIFKRQDVKLLQELLSDLKQTMLKISSKELSYNDGFFVRLSTRSPKDGALKKRAQFMSTLKEELQNCSNNESLAVVRSFNTKLCVGNARRAIELLVHSERVYTDLFRSMLFLDEKLKKNDTNELHGQGLVVRMFKKMKEPEYEFRVFVKYDGKKHNITAISQYFKSCYLEKLDFQPNLKQSIQQEIERLKNCVTDRLKTTESFVMDVSVEFTQAAVECVQYEIAKVWMIELNPFSKQTSACMFNWHEKKSENILEGKSQMQFLTLEHRLAKQKCRQELSEDVRSMLEEINGPIEPVEDQENEKDEKKCFIQ